MMLAKHDPTFSLGDLMIFSILALIIVIGFIYVRKNYKLQPD